MRFGAAIPVHNDWRFIPAVTGQLLKVCDRVMILRSTRSFSGHPLELKPLPKLDPRIEIIEKRWESEGDTRNAGTDLLCDPTQGGDCDYVFTVDADEIFTTDSLEFLKQTASRGHRAVACYLHTYWKTPQYEIDPPERICATVVIHKDVKFKFMRVIEGGQHILGQKLMHHLSYVRTDEELKEKLKLYAHAHQISDKWYDRVWRGWDLDHAMKNLNPINPNSFGRAIPVKNDDLEVILAQYGVK